MRTYGVIPWLANSGRSGKGAQTEYALYVEDNIALNGGKTFLTPALRWGQTQRFRFRMDAIAQLLPRLQSGMENQRRHRACLQSTQPLSKPAKLPADQRQ